MLAITTDDILKIANILLSPTIAFLTAILALVIDSKSNRSPVARERVEKVYHPDNFCSPDKASHLLLSDKSPAWL